MPETEEPAPITDMPCPKCGGHLVASTSAPCTGQVPTPNFPEEADNV